MNIQRITTITPNEPIHFWTLPFTADAVTYTLIDPPTERELETICLQIGYLINGNNKNDNLHFVVLFPLYGVALFFMPKRGLLSDLTSNNLPEPFKRAKEQITKTAQDVIYSYKKSIAKNQ